MTNTLNPIKEPFPEDIVKLLSRYPKIDGYLLTLFRTFANSQRFLEKGVPNLLDEESPLKIRDREIVILRVTANNNCEYEWGIHVTVFSKLANLSEPHIAATLTKDIDPELWTIEEYHLLKAIDEICSLGSISDKVLKYFLRDWTVEQQLEILALCGAYHTVSFVANIARLPSEEFAAKFPR